jgi:hypothetical protein
MFLNECSPEEANESMRKDITESQHAIDQIEAADRERAAANPAKRENQASSPASSPASKGVVFSFLNFVTLGGISGSNATSTGTGSSATAPTAAAAAATAPTAPAAPAVSEGSEHDVSSPTSTDRKRSREESEKQIVRCQDAIAHNLQTIMKLRASMI